jgi:hypothetical protein
MGGARTHGDEHHDRWAAGDDALLPLPAKLHAVAGLIVVFRAGSRVLATSQTILGREILFGMLKVDQVDYNRAEVSLERVLEVAGISTR